tara:strand:+ start:25 stop:480 length:456 start_codon:yes stop_codon:yes gene_type:complete
MNFKKGNFVDPNNGFKQGQFKDFGSINQAPSKVTNFMRQFKSNPKYSFARTLLTGLSFVPIGRIGAGAIKIFKSKTGVSTAKTIGSKLPSQSSTQIINNKVNQNIQNLTKDVPIVGTNRTMQVAKSSDTKAISFVNPRISMTAAERRAAGY